MAPRKDKSPKTLDALCKDVFKTVNGQALLEKLVQMYVNGGVYHAETNVMIRRAAEHDLIQRLVFYTNSPNLEDLLEHGHDLDNADTFDTI